MANYRRESNAEAAAHASNPNNPNADAAEAKAAEADAEAPKAVEPEAKGKAPASMLKEIGIKSADVLSYNAESKTLVSAQGGKYRTGADGKTAHLSGPLLKADDKE